MSFAVALVIMAAITQVGVLLIERRYPPKGRMIDVAGGRLHVVELGPEHENWVPIVVIHGASSNLEALRQPLGDLLAQDRRVLLIDRPGHGWSTRDRLSHSTPAMQARMIDEALGKLGVDRAIIVGHSWAGALAAAFAINHPQRVGGLVMLSPVTHRWVGGIPWHHNLGAIPIIGPLFAYTFALPTGMLMIDKGARGAFLPQTIPDNYVRDTSLKLLLRPREFLANARDMVTLKAAVTEQMLRYGEIKAPTVVIHGDADTTVYLDVHARQFVQAVPHASLIVVPGVGHVIQNAAAETIIAAIETVMPPVAGTATAAR